MDIRPVKNKAKKPVEKFEEPAFIEPEKMAQAEDNSANFGAKTPPAKKKKNPLTKLKSTWSGFGKKQKIAAVIAAVLLLGGSAYGLSQVLKKDPPPPPPAPTVVEEPAPEPPKPTTEASKLTGVQISPELNQRSITAVMIENSVDARPQAGLKDAGVVFEAIAEGGITRFAALFQESQPDYIGPVRSARPYYIDWILAFDPAYAHAGGSGEALALIQQLGVKDMDHGANGSAFQRVSNRYAPHNLYTSTAALDEVKARRGYTTSTFTPLLRGEEKPVAVPNVTKIDLNPSKELYAVHYDYAAETNSYNRVLAGRPHTDERSGAQLSPKVVVALIVPYSIHPDRIHSVYQTIGSGKVFVFQNGTVVEGTWQKTDRKAQIVLTDTAGQPIGLNPGQTWFTALAGADRVGYSGP